MSQTKTAPEVSAKKNAASKNGTEKKKRAVRSTDARLAAISKSLFKFPIDVRSKFIADLKIKNDELIAAELASIQDRIASLTTLKC